ncbi:MAG: hypothetical protein ACXWLQ_08140, partial [Rhizomicrobium sp.]
FDGNESAQKNATRCHRLTDKRRGKRSQRHYPVPTHHLGAVVTDQSPYGVAKLGLEYLEKLVAEAEALL